MFTAMSTYLEEIRDNPNHSRRASIAMNKIQLGLLVLEETSKYWNAAKWTYALFKFLNDRNFDVFQKAPWQSRWPSPSSTAINQPFDHSQALDLDLEALLSFEWSAADLQDWFMRAGVFEQSDLAISNATFAGH